MISLPSIDLRIVGPGDLEKHFLEVLRPGESVRDATDTERTLPSWFYEVPSWQAAREIQITPHFGLWELIDVDIREFALMRRFPRYVPCAITILAAHLQVLRSELGRVVRIAANGGYRSPGHALSSPVTPHCWGTAANIYRIGDDWMNSPQQLRKYIDIVRRTLPGIWVRPYGARPGFTFDHLHIDLAYVTVDPHVHQAGHERR